MTPIPFEKLMDWMIYEYANDSTVFGIDKSKFYKNTSGNTVKILRTNIDSPIGPAAGPNTQLAQNLIAAYISGARFLELKTVQTIDGEDLRKCIARPCINAEDEGYNCEWSTELTVAQAYEEYVKGWFAVHVAAIELDLGQESSCIFNMSVGYDFEGITSKKIDDFINNMSDASKTAIWKSCTAYLLSNINKFKKLTKEHIEDISPVISSSITLSTLHGCPPEEIEKIADYFLTKKKLHTYIKCNPTLLGYGFVRNILDEMGYSYIAFGERHFDQDLKFSDAVLLIERLQKIAYRENLEFGVKLTNTFPVQAKENELPSEFMYMSGRALFPLSINVAKELSVYFDGNLPISYSGGADFFNIESLLKVGIKPITICTTILKPGGYSRIQQLSKTAENVDTNLKGIAVEELKKLADNISKDIHLVKNAREGKSRKTDSILPLYDCYKAPCKDGGCPIQQQIPEYLYYVANKQYDKAFEVIAIDNATPSILSLICDHNCQNKCTRLDYETPLQIRNAKKIAVENAQQRFVDNIKKVPLKTNKKVVVIGAGPAGVAAGTYLRRNGVDVTVLEKRDSPMGIVQYIIPEFRIHQNDIDLDYNMAINTGVDFKYGIDANYSIEDLKKEYDYIIIATGAWEKGYNPVQEDKDNILDALEFLEKAKPDYSDIDLGSKIAVIGAGDVAMDSARAAKRTKSAKEVDIVYRRTREYMPAEPEEIQLALSDNVEFKELLSPISYDGKTLEVQAMELAEKGADGRRKVVPTKQTKRLEYDTVISATGARVDTMHLTKNHITQENNHYAVLNENNESSIKNVYIAGDCKKGAATVVKAIADSKIIAKDILSKLHIEHDFVKVELQIDNSVIQQNRAILKDASMNASDSKRCLSCEQVCELCCEVCPNRANISIMILGKSQILHIDGMCNECGNCGVFCPHIGDPYKDKITLFWSEEDFRDSTNKGVYFVDNNSVMIRNEISEVMICNIYDDNISHELKGIIDTIKANYSYLII